MKSAPWYRLGITPSPGWPVHRTGPVAGRFRVDEQGLLPSTAWGIQQVIPAGPAGAGQWVRMRISSPNQGPQLVPGARPKRPNQGSQTVALPPLRGGAQIEALRMEWRLPGAFGEMGGFCQNGLRCWQPRPKPGMKRAGRTELFLASDGSPTGPGPSNHCCAFTAPCALLKRWVVPGTAPTLSVFTERPEREAPSV